MWKHFKQLIIILFLLKEFLLKKDETIENQSFYLILSLNYFPTTCLFISRKKEACMNKLKKSRQTLKTNIFIHGLWRQSFENKEDEEEIEELNQNEKIKFLFENSLLNELNTYWISGTDNSNYKLWYHEYNKHGRVLYPNDYYDFFQNGINLYKKISAERIFDGIVLNNSIDYIFDYNKLYSHLYTYFGGDYFRMKCFKNSDNTSQYLREIIIYFKLNKEYMTVPYKDKVKDDDYTDEVNYKKRCTKDMMIILPRSY